jgi:hypothetical protein
MTGSAPSGSDVRFHAEPRGPLMAKLARIERWIYEHEHRGETVSEDLVYLVSRIEHRAWMRDNDHLPITEEES